MFHESMNEDLHESIQNTVTNRLNVANSFLQELNKSNKNSELLEKTKECIYNERKDIEKSLEIVREIFNTWKVIIPQNIQTLTTTVNNITAAGIMAQNTVNDYIHTLINNKK